MVFRHGTQLRPSPPPPSHFSLTHFPDYLQKDYSPWKGRILRKRWKKSRAGRRASSKTMKTWENLSFQNKPSIIENPKELCGLLDHKGIKLSLCLKVLFTTLHPHQFFYLSVFSLPLLCMRVLLPCLCPTALCFPFIFSSWIPSLYYSYSSCFFNYSPFGINNWSRYEYLRRLLFIPHCYYYYHLLGLLWNNELVLAKITVSFLNVSFPLSRSDSETRS